MPLSIAALLPTRETNPQYLTPTPAVSCTVVASDVAFLLIEKTGAELSDGLEVRLCGGLVSELMFFEEIAAKK
jgi:hypothetical protein